MKTLKSDIKLSKIALLFVSILIIQSCNSTAIKETNKDTGIITKQYKYVQISTGQDAVYNEDGIEIDDINANDSLFGQDANYLKGKKMAYKKNYDGTTIDLNTELMWQTIPTTEGFNWQAANDYCEKLELGGYDDWRMPTLKELYSISDFSSGWPYLDINYFYLANIDFVDKSEQYWSSNKYIGHTEEGQYTAAFGVNHTTGHIKAYPGEAPMEKKNRRRVLNKNKPPSNGNTPPPNGNRPPPNGNRPPPNGNKPPPNGNKPPSEPEIPSEKGRKLMGNPMLKHVRAVRGSIYGTNDFEDNKDGTITDKATELMWSKGDNKKGLNWKSALFYAENSELAGYSDWRLPNVKELQGIVDYSFAPNAKDITQIGAAIDPMFTCSRFRNENKDKDYPYYWTSTSARFQKGESYYYAWYVAFGRAVNKEGLDFHGAGAVRFDTKNEDGPAGEGGERCNNYVRLVRNVN